MERRARCTFYCRYACVSLHYSAPDASYSHSPEDTLTPQPATRPFPHSDMTNVCTLHLTQPDALPNPIHSLALPTRFCLRLSHRTCRVDVRIMTVFTGSPAACGNSTRKRIPPLSLYRHSPPLCRCGCSCALTMPWSGRNVSKL